MPPRQPLFAEYFEYTYTKQCVYAPDGKTKISDTVAFYGTLEGGLDARGVQALVIDEADRMLDLGFEPQLAAIVRALVDTGKSVLVTSHTHGAVDNVLERLPGVGVDDGIARAGGEGGKASAFAAAFCPGGAKHAARSVEELRRLADTARVVGATCYAAANHPLIARRRARRDKPLAASSAPETKKGPEPDTGAFDVVLVDEAGQMTLPASVPALLRGAVYVLVGDPQQLPPLVGRH